MNTFVFIKEGTHRNSNVPAGVYAVTKAYNSDKGTITVVSPTLESGAVREPFVNDTARVKVEPVNFFVCDSEGNELTEEQIKAMAPAATANTDEDGEAKAAAYFASESDEDAMERIGHNFYMMQQVVRAVAKGTIRGLVISGGPGVGKTFESTEALMEVNADRLARDQKPNFDIVKGKVTAIQLFKKLWDNSTKGFVTVFDDADSMLFEEDCMNILKAALDSGEKRTISYLSSSQELRAADIPNQFDFEGSVIFLTNLDFVKMGNSNAKNAPHLQAIVSRCHYMDIEVSTVRDCLLRIRQVVEGGMLDIFEFTNDEENVILEFVNENSGALTELSLRMVKKIADLVKMDPPEGWEEFVVSTCFRKTAKYNWKIQQKEKAEAKAA